MLSGSSFVAVGSSRQAAVPDEPVSKGEVSGPPTRLPPACSVVTALPRMPPPPSRPYFLSVTLALSSPYVRSLVGFEGWHFRCLAACFLLQAPGLSPIGAPASLLLYYYPSFVPWLSFPREQNSCLTAPCIGP